MFGGLELVDGAAVVALAPAERTLLAALVSRVGERVAVEVLQEALWSNRCPPSARKTLQGHILRLRRVLGSSAIVEQHGGYRLDPDCVHVDAQQVTLLLTAARVAIDRGDPEDAVGLLGEARRSFRGDSYDGVPDAALPAGEVHRLDELRAMVLEEANEAELACGRGGGCVGELEAFVERNPYRERSWGQLMRALYEAGRPADALDAYRRARHSLTTDLGLEPGPVLRDLEQAVLTHDVRLLRLGASGPVLGRSNLPTELSPIIGRHAELTALRQLCRDSRLVTLTGAGGIGKTRLAIELAAQVAGDHAYGPFFADLAPVGDVELVPTVLAAALGVLVDPHDDVMERVCRALECHLVLLVMDNCEHLLPQLAEVVVRLLMSTPGLRVVASSRERLEVPGERVWTVEPLAVPCPSSSPEQIRRSEAGELFATRLPRNVTDRPLNAEDINAIASICRSVDGMPLALELAAARSRSLSLPELAGRLEQSIRELAIAGHGVVPRHRTMRAALDWGFRLLSPAAQTVLQAMSMFAGGCDLSAVTAVCIDHGDEPSSLDIVDELVRTSFVVVDLARAPARYRLLEPVRQYAAELLEASGDRDDRQRRHLRFYADYAHALDEGADESGRVPLEELHRELGNLRVALDWAANATELTGAGVELAADLYYVWTGGAHHAEGVARLEHLLGTGAGSSEARSRAARVAAIVAAGMGDSDRTLALGEQALEEAAGCVDDTYEGRARQILAQVVLQRGDVAAARQYLAPALRQRRDRSSDCNALCTLTRAQIDLVAAALNSSASSAEEVINGDFGFVPYIGAEARSILAQVMLERGDVTLARWWLTDALALCTASGEWAATVAARLDLASLESASGHFDSAHTHFAAASELGGERARLWDLRFYVARADLELDGGHAREAAALAEAAIRLAYQMTMAVERCGCLRRLGDAQMACDDPGSALSTFRHLVSRARAIPAPCRVAEGHEGAAAASKALGQQRSARRHAAVATRIRQHTSSRRLRRPAVEIHLESMGV